MKFGVATQGAVQQLSLHTAGVCDEDIDGVGGGGSQIGQIVSLKLKEKRCGDSREKQMESTRTWVTKCGRHSQNGNCDFRTPKIV